MSFMRFPATTAATAKAAVASAAVAALAIACAPDSGLTMGSLLLDAPSTVSQGVHGVCPGGATTFGVDVSDYQSDIDWGTAAGAGVKFAFIRVSDGTGYPDSKYSQNWPAARAAGVVRGTYQFFRSSDDPIAQADLLISQMGALQPGDMPPVADVESTDGVDNAGRANRLQQWLDHVEQATGVTPIIYTGGYFWEDNVGADFSRYPLWHAGYTGGNCPSSVAAQWGDWAFWQYTSTGGVSGIPGANVDQDNFNGTLDDLRARFGASAVCGDGVCGGGEDHNSCAGDCPICEALPAAGGVVGEDSVCFTGGGPQQYMRHVNDAGDGGSLIWTHTTADPAEANFGHWQLLVSEAGHYKIEAYTDAAYAQSHQSRYVVHHVVNGQAVDDSAVVDQTAVNGWATVVDDLELAVGDGQFVHLSDNTGEDLAGNVQLVFDGVRLTRLDAVVPGEGEGEGSIGGEGEGSGSEGEGDPGEVNPNGGGGVHRVALVAPPGGKGGCGQTSSSSSLLALALLVLLRRRRGH